MSNNKGIERHLLGGMEEGLGVYCVGGTVLHLPCSLAAGQETALSPTGLLLQVSVSLRGDFLGHKFASAFSLCFSHF